MENLEGDSAVVLGILRKVHGRHTAATQLAIDGVQPRKGGFQSLDWEHRRNWLVYLGKGQSTWSARLSRSRQSVLSDQLSAGVACCSCAVLLMFVVHRLHWTTNASRLGDCLESRFWRKDRPRLNGRFHWLSLVVQSLIRASPASRESSRRRTGLGIHRQSGQSATR